jgi:ADP-heptose:LPS heptosyltransferase
MASKKKSILIIKHGALGDFILSFGPFKAIRNYHLNDQLFLLTTNTFKEFAEESHYFDGVIVDDRVNFWNIKKIFKLAGYLRKKNFYRIYDLQTSQRSSFYYNFFRMRNYVEWSGIASGCTHPDKNPDRNKIHTIERHRIQLAEIGIKNIKLSDLSWVKSTNNFRIKKPYVLFSPGASSHRPKKRWPEKNYVELARKFIHKKITPILLGDFEDIEIANFISLNTNGCINLVNKTTIQDLCSLARDAQLAIGNDTGPMHAFSMSSCHSLVLFSDDSNPNRCAPRSINKKKLVKIIQKKDLRDLTVDEVLDCLRNDFRYEL